MSLLYSEYLVGLSQGEVLGRLRQSAPERSWHVEEESGSSLFLIKDRSPFFLLFGGSAPRLAVTIAQTEGWTMLRIVGWVPRLEGLRSCLHNEIRKLLAEANLTPLRQPVPDSIPVYWNPKTVSPSWLRRTESVEWSWAALLVPVLAFSLWLGWPTVQVFAIPWALGLFLGPALVVEVVSRRALGIQSRRRMTDGVLMAVTNVVLVVAVLVVLDLFS
jgi:hypothetical protein